MSKMTYVDAQANVGVSIKLAEAIGQLMRIMGVSTRLSRSLRKNSFSKLPVVGVLISLLALAMGGSAWASGFVPTIRVQTLPQTLVLGDQLNVHWQAELAQRCFINGEEQSGTQGTWLWQPDTAGEHIARIVCLGNNNRAAFARKELVLDVQPLSVRQFRVSAAGQDLFVGNDIPDNQTLSGNDIEIAKTPVTFELQFNNNFDSLNCSIQGQNMQVQEGLWSASLLPAYFRESLTLTCHTQSGRSLLTRQLQLQAQDPQLVQQRDNFFLYMPRYTLNNNNATDFAYPELSYYYELHRLIMMSRAYQDPQAFGLTMGTVEYARVENYLVNVGESYFQPCAGYDFNNGDPRQCRSENRIGKYYRWRSFNGAPRWRSSHPKVEWRSAAGIAQAVKAILLQHPNSDEVCDVSDRPAEVRAQSLSCRAKNIRRLLYHEVWLKWQDLNYVANDLAFDNAIVHTLQGTDVAHYVSWLQLIVDMFEATAHIPHNANCTQNCGFAVPASQLDNMLQYAEALPNGLVNLHCRRDRRSSCAWRTYEFAQTRSNDLSHLAVYVSVIAAKGQDQVCSAQRPSLCLSTSNLITTLKEKAWVDDIANDGLAKEFPKFDPFLNGYCREHYQDVNDPLYSFCQDHWLTESVRSNFHRSLFGYADLARYDRELAIMLRTAADTNQDGKLTPRGDILMRDYAIALYFSLRNPTQLQ